MTEQRAWREVTIPAFDMLILCCSIASWMLTLIEDINFLVHMIQIFARDWSTKIYAHTFPYLSWSFILSNSSIRQIPLSARTRAPPSSVHSRVTGSLCTDAVRPTAEAPLPVVYTALCPVFSTYLGEKNVFLEVNNRLLLSNQSSHSQINWGRSYFKNCDLAVPGSPRRSTFMSPRNLCFPSTFFSWPPNIARAIAVFISSWP